MESEFTVKISLTKHEHDNPKCPYYWSLLKWDDSWHQIAFGWEISPTKCFSAAMESYQEIVQPDVKTQKISPSIEG